ncbi:MAG: hypothetical protein WBF99_04150 [Xanthobacteraceae bacterium]
MVSFRRFHFGVRFVAALVVAGFRCRVIARSIFRRRRSSAVFAVAMNLSDTQIEAGPRSKKFPPTFLEPEMGSELAKKIERLASTSIGWKRRLGKRIIAQYQWVDIISINVFRVIPALSERCSRVPRERH